MQVYEAPRYKGRNLYLDICDYKGNCVCNVYNSERDVSGQATDVFVTTERNGWKELSFKLPTTCQGENGEEHNYRIDFLIADYRLRVIDDYETDWFLISEPKVTHSAFSTNIEVRASHICQLLKTKNLNLEFSDEEGNNVGNAKQLLTTILDGTGWYVGDVASFIEEDVPGNIEKVRSLECSAKTGAFRMVELMCEKFDAKPVYHGEGYVLLEEDPGDMSTNYSAYCKLSENSSRTRPNGPCKMVHGLWHTYVQLTAAATYQPDTYYRYKVKSIDIVPMNPFSEDIEEGEIPNLVVSGDRKAIELHYAKNLKDITRTLNTENIVTKLYAYGSYGDLNGLCSIQTCKHQEYYFENTQTYNAGQEFRFTDDYGAIRYFTIEDQWTASSPIGWSKLDFASRSYVWYPRVRKMYDVYKEPKTTTYVILNNPRVVEYQNYFPALMNFDYYEKIGLLDRATKQKIAEYQRDMVGYYQASETAAENFANGLTELSMLADSQTGFLRLAIKPTTGMPYGYTVNNSDQSITLEIDTSQGDNGVLYRSDYLESKRNYFEWHVAKQLQPDGEPVSGSPSALLIVHDTDPVTWDRVYLKKIDDRVNANGEPADYDYGLNMGDEPRKITVWGKLTTSDKGTIPPYSASDRFYLFCTVSTSGTLGALQYQEWAVRNTQITTATSVSKEVHPFYFVDARWVTYITSNSFVAYEPPLSTVGISGQYGWYYRFFTGQWFAGELYFCGPKDTSWHYVYMQDEEPVVSIEDPQPYFFNTRLRTLWVWANNRWVEMEDATERRMATCFSEVWYLCRRRDQLYFGIWEKYKYKVTSALSPGRYIIDSGYDYRWAFTTDITVPVNNTIYIDTSNNYVYQDGDVTHIVKATVTPEYTIKPMPSNLISEDSFEQGELDSTDGHEISVASSVTNKWRTGYIKVYPGYQYESNLPSGTVIYFFDEKKKYRGKIGSGSTGTFTIPTQTTADYESEGYKPDARYMRIYYPGYDNYLVNRYVRMRGYDTKVFTADNDELPYTVLNDVTHDGELKGLNNLTKNFADLSDTIYNTYLPTLKNTQNAITENDNTLSNLLGDMLREGYWQETDYVEGDEPKLYRDALDNLSVIAHPEAEYNISYIDLYGSNLDIDFSADGENVSWPDIQITDAIHLVDPEIDVNCWAYIDKIQKCYDQPWKTTIDINTKLSLIGQHDFTDVMTRIAEVASASKSKQALVDRITQITSEDGYVYASKIVGEWEAKLKAVESSWYTDNHGNIVFTSADGMMAMMLTGAGFCIASSKDENGWVWSTLATGEGIAANKIIGKYLNIETIQAGSITLDKLNAFIGHDLDISSNKTLRLYATADGLRPAGSLKTTDAIIEIAAGEGNTPAHINIASGGALNMTGATVTLSSQGSMSIESGSDLSIATGGTFTVASGNFSVDSSGNVTISGDITATTGNIGGWLVGNGYLYSGDGGNHVRLNTDTTTNTVKDYAIWAGANLPTDASFAVKWDGEVISKNIEISGGSLAGWTIGSTYIGNAATLANSTIGLYKTTGNNIAIWAGGKHSETPTFRVTAAGKLYATGAEISGTITVTEGGDIGGWSVGANSLYSYNKNGNANQQNLTYVGLNSDPASDYAMWAGHKTAASAPFSVKRNGYVTASNFHTDGGVLSGFEYDANTILYKPVEHSEFAIDGDPNSDYIIYAGRIIQDGQQVDLTSSNANLAPFYVKKDGTMFCSNAVIYGEVQAFAGFIGGYVDAQGKGHIYTTAEGGWSIYQHYLVSGASTKQVGLSSDCNAEATIAIWAGGDWNPETSNGHGINDAPFQVKRDGQVKATKLYASGGEIGSWVIDGERLTGGNGNSTVCLYASTTGTYNTYAMWAGKAYPYTTSNNTTTYAPFRLTKAGKLYATDAEISGKITATSGTIGGWTIGNNGSTSSPSYYFGNSTTLASATIGIRNTTGGNIVFWAGAAAYQSGIDASTIPFYVTGNGKLHATNIDIAGGTITIGSNFSVSSTGVLTATSAVLSGKITASSGAIGGWVINSSFIGGGYHGTADAHKTSANYYKTGMSSASSGGGFWAGRTTTTSGGTTTTTTKFSVNSDGKLTASDVKITGGELSIGSNFSVSNTGKLTSSDIYVTGGTITIGSNFSVSSSGASISGAVTITSGSISIKDSSNNENFKVSTSGELTAKKGKIADWTIGSNLLSGSYKASYSTATNVDFTVGMSPASSPYCYYIKKTGTVAVPRTPGYWGSGSGNEFYVFSVNSMGQLCATTVTTGDLSAHNGTFTGNGTFSGGMSVSLDTVISGSLSCSGLGVFGEAQVTGNLEVGSSAINKNITVYGNITASGTVTCNNYLYLPGSRTSGSNTEISTIIFGGTTNSDYPRLICRNNGGNNGHGWQLVWLDRSGHEYIIISADGYSTLP